MDKKLECEIVCDLLPSYVDGLASDVTKKAVDEHLKDCVNCSQALQRMRETEPQSAEPDEVDYLKKVRHQTNRRSLLSGIILMMIGMSLLSFRLFYIGREADGTEVALNVSVEDNKVLLSGTLASSGQAVSRVTFSNGNGMVEFKVYTVPKTFFNKGDFNETYVAECTVGQVRVGNRIVWENGMEIGSMASELYEVSNPFAGDMSSNNNIASILGISDQFGPYTNELQTETESCTWSLILETPISKEEEGVAKEIMSADAYAMLAVVGNLNSVIWNYDTEEGQKEYTVTKAEATSFAGQDIKQFANSASDLQSLLGSLNFKWSGIRNYSR